MIQPSTNRRFPRCIVFWCLGFTYYLKRATRSIMITTKVRFTIKYSNALYISDIEARISFKVWIVNALAHDRRKHKVLESQ